MKRITIITIVSIFLFHLASRAQNTTSGAIFPKGTKTTANFTGTVWVKTLVPIDSTFQCVVGTVTFEPGARSYWHIHNAGQILLVTDGTGYTQEKGKPLRVVHKGDYHLPAKHRALAWCCTGQFNDTYFDNPER